MTNLRLFLLLVFVLFISDAASNDSLTFSQTVNVGAKLGFSVPQLANKSDNEYSEGYKSRFAPAFGLYLNNYFTSHFALQLEVLFVGQGGKRNEMQPIPREELESLPIPPGMNLYADFETEAILNYLEIPLLAKYNIDLSENWSIYGDFGPYLGIILNAKTITSGSSRIYLDKDGNIPLTDPLGNPLPEMSFDNERTITEDIEPTNFGLTGGIGVSYNFGSSELNLDIRGAGGFTHIQKDEANGANTTGALVVTAGYSIEL